MNIQMLLYMKDSFHQKIFLIVITKNTQEKAKRRREYWRNLSKQEIGLVFAFNIFSKAIPQTKLWCDLFRVFK